MRNQLRTLAGLAIALTLVSGTADARSGLGGSFGSRGSRTWSAPAYTNTAPSYAAPMQRSLTPATPSYTQPNYAAPPAYAPAMGGGSAFTSGLLGGLLGAGIGGMLFGHGMFGGITGGMGFLGLLIQIGLLFLVGRWLFRRFAGTPALAGGPPLYARQASPSPSGMPPGRPASDGATLAVTKADFAAFEQTLQAIQAAWSQSDINTLRSLTTPEMLSYFGEQLAELSSRGLRNVVSNVRLQQGDLSEAWSEGGRDYATVAMRFTMNDVTLDAGGRVVDGSPTELTSATELWTFLKAPGGRWILSAIQQAR